MIKITFEDINVCFVEEPSGDININPKFVTKWGHIEVYNNKDGEAIAKVTGFISDGKNKADGLKYIKK